jgi:type I restriction enzyme S subunit
MGSCGMYISDSKEYLTNEAIKNFNIITVPKGSVLLSFKLTVGRVCIADKNLTTNEAIARFLMPKDFYTPFVYLYLKQFKYRTLGSTSSIATAINSKIIKNMPFFLPDEDIIKQFYNAINPLFELINNKCQEIKALSDLRDSLMKKLIPTLNK